MKKLKGFTLVELLVVIAVIGILSAVVILNTQSAKDKAHFANAKVALNSIQKIAISCFDTGKDELNATTPVAASATTPICVKKGTLTVSDTEKDNWPVPETGFTYSVSSPADPVGWNIVVTNTKTPATKFTCTATACS